MHYCPGHVVGVQPHTFGVPPPPQVWGGVQVPQFTMPPWQFGIEPQLSGGGHVVISVHVVDVEMETVVVVVLVSHTFGVPPPPQVWGGTQVPQSSVPPQPSEIDPQFLP